MITEKMSLLDRAMRVAEEYPVFPCNSRKAPIVPGGFKAATQNDEEVQRMFALPNAAMIGVPTGAVSGISVIDIDVKDGRDGLTWERENASLLGQTLKSKTISGGRHYYISTAQASEIAQASQDVSMSEEMGGTSSTHILKAINS